MSLPNLHFEKGRTIIWMYGAWLSLVERVVRDYEAAGSNPVTPTYKKLMQIEVITFTTICMSFLYYLSNYSIQDYF